MFGFSSHRLRAHKPLEGVLVLYCLTEQFFALGQIYRTTIILLTVLLYTTDCCTTTTLTYDITSLNTYFEGRFYQLLVCCSSHTFALSILSVVHRPRLHIVALRTIIYFAKRKRKWHTKLLPPKTPCTTRRGV